MIERNMLDRTAKYLSWYPRRKCIIIIMNFVNSSFVFTSLFQVVKGNAIDFPDDSENFCVEFRWNNNFPNHVYHQHYSLLTDCYLNSFWSPWKFPEIRVTLIKFTKIVFNEFRSKRWAFKISVLKRFKFFTGSY